MFSELEAIKETPHFLVLDFVCDNYLISFNESNVVYKQGMYARYKKWCSKNNRACITFDKFDEEIMKNNEVKCFTHFGKDYYTNPIYDPE